MILGFSKISKRFGWWCVEVMRYLQWSLLASALSVQSLMRNLSSDSDLWQCFFEILWDLLSSFSCILLVISGDAWIAATNILLFGFWIFRPSRALASGTLWHVGDLDIWGFPWMGVPQNGWFTSGGIPLTWMIWGYPHFRKPSRYPFRMKVSMKTSPVDSQRIQVSR